MSSKYYSNLQSYEPDDCALECAHGFTHRQSLPGSDIDANFGTCECAISNPLIIEPISFTLFSAPSYGAHVNADLLSYCW